MAVSYGSLRAALDGADTGALAGLSLTVLRNVMVESGEVAYRYHAMLAGLSASISFGEYDNIFQEAVGGSDQLGPDTDVCLVFMVLETVSWELAREFAGLSEERVREESERVLDLIRQVVRGIRGQTQAMILWHGFLQPAFPAYGIHDSQIEHGQCGTIRALNQGIREILREEQNAYFVDLDLCRARVGEGDFLDSRFWHMGRAPFSLDGLYEIAQEDMKFIRALKGRNRKCLALDCDNTLWGGIIGEDGLSGIKLGKDYPGSCFYEFQKEIVSLYQRGVIIALCSKNNHADVMEVFGKHPDMVLAEEHLAALQVNWDDKATNLRRIAEELNIGLDSMVFMDDSEFEIGLVRQELPEVLCVQMPKAQPSQYRGILASLGVFDTLAVTGEDRKRGAMYKAEAGRKRLRAAVTDLESYYESLEMVVRLCMADEFAVPRMAQQTQKTNQFNLTTRRYSEADVVSFMQSGRHDVFYLKLGDKFGDSGIVGTCILEYEGRTARIDSLLLSCRVLGRKVEEIFLRQALCLAAARGAEEVLGEYIRTMKNAQVERFYPEHGFEPHEEKGGSNAVYRYDLAKGIPEPPKFFKEILTTCE